MRRGRRRFGGWALALLTVGLIPAQEVAAQEVSVVIGQFLGDKVGELSDLGGALQPEFRDAALYGGRLGFSWLMVGVEASVVVGPTGVKLPLIEDIDARVLYAEVDLILRLLPGPVSPYLAAGLGLHSFRFELPGQQIQESRLGYNFGAGVKLGLGSFALRLDLRDHLTNFDLTVLDPQLVEILDLEDKLTLHNVELSGGLSIDF